MSPGLSQAPRAEPQSRHTSSVLDAPEFPDFDNSEMETAEGKAVDIGTLDLEALDLVSAALPVPDDSGVTDFEDPLLGLSSCDPVEPCVSTVIHDLNLGSQNIIPLDPASFPEPVNIPEFPEPAVSEQWSQSEEFSVDPQSNSQADDADLGTAEFQSPVQEMDSCNHASLDDGIQSHSR